MGKAFEDIITEAKSECNLNDLCYGVYYNTNSGIVGLCIDVGILGSYNPSSDFVLVKAYPPPTSSNNPDASQTVCTKDCIYQEVQGKTCEMDVHVLEEVYSLEKAKSICTPK